MNRSSRSSWKAGLSLTKPGSKLVATARDQKKRSLALRYGWSLFMTCAQHFQDFAEVLRPVMSVGVRWILRYKLRNKKSVWAQRQVRGRYERQALLLCTRGVDVLKDPPELRSS